MNSSDIKALIQKFGRPAYENTNGVLSHLNENFWAAYYAKKRERIIFEPFEQEFYDYDSGSGIFTLKSSDAIQVELSALMLDGSRDWQGFKALEQFRSAKNLNGAITFLRGQVEEHDFFDQDHHYVHLGNCTLKFEPDGSKYSVEQFSHLHRSRNRSPIFFDPNATCPEFEAKILGHLPTDDRMLLQKYAGQCLLGRNLTQRFVILDGIAGASKGAFVSTQIVRDDSLMGNGQSRSLTVEEIISEYTHDCIEDKQWTPLTTSVAEKQLPDLMLQHFGTPKTHDVPRNGKNKRGFWKVRFI